ncbi:SMP-30/gluconolactonase/LRE family protein [Streptomyces sp. NPDC060209]|uniref:SMP-30/gluconolactonase/LRE family protein n=1 Tax=Streptomyces sp. NPDC060209 TaxID=3347073 RepID=UPI0036636BFF
MTHGSLPLINRFRLAVATAATAAAFASTPYASAAPTGAQPVLNQVKTEAAFDFAAGDAPENITVNPDSSMTISMLGSSAAMPPKLVRISPSGHRTTLAVGHKGDTITGNARGNDGTVFYNVMSKDASRTGVWEIPVSGSPQRLAALPADASPNGLAIGPNGRTLYVADSLKSTVWAVPTSDGRAAVWLTDPALAPDKSASVPLGANGLRYHNGSVWVSNISHNTLLRIPVTQSGAPGRIHTVTSHLTGVDDFSFLDERSDVVFAAENERNEIVMVYPDGTTKTVLTASSGLASPTSTAVRGRRLYITNAGLNEPHDAKLQSATINRTALLNHS